MVSATDATSAAAGPLAQATGANKLGKDAFLNLLITQLRNQDPMKPMDDTQFISQLAQFSSLEQMQTMNTNLTNLAAAQNTFQQGVALIGKTVEAVNPDYLSDPNGTAPKTITGKVDSVDLRTGSPVLSIGGKPIPVENVIMVS
jgi:flagellar basal-body rod modification protein FlgD